MCLVHATWWCGIQSAASRLYGHKVESLVRVSDLEFHTCAWESASGPHEDPVRVNSHGVVDLPQSARRCLLVVTHKSSVCPGRVHHLMALCPREGAIACGCFCQFILSATPK